MLRRYHPFRHLTIHHRYAEGFYDTLQVAMAIRSVLLRLRLIYTFMRYRFRDQKGDDVTLRCSQCARFRRWL